MTTVYVVIAVLALCGAGVLLWLDRRRAEEPHRGRQAWADEYGYTFTARDDSLRRKWNRAGMEVPEHVGVVDVVRGSYYGEAMYIFDLADTSTIVALERTVDSDVLIDLRREHVLAPVEEDVDLLGAMGQRVMFTTDREAARRVCDRRMVNLATEAPDFIEILWNEGRWTLASTPPITEAEDIEEALRVLRRFTDLLRVLPPRVEPRELDTSHADPGHPVPRRERSAARESATENTESTVGRRSSGGSHRSPL